MSTSTSAPTPTRRALSALAAAALALTGLLVAAAPAAAAGAELVLDDFVAPAPGNRSAVTNGASVSEGPSGTRVTITPGGGSRYAQFTWTFATPVDLTANGMRQLQLTYSGAQGTDAAGNALSNPVMMAMYVEDADGRTRGRGGTGVISGSGTFVTNFYPQTPDDVRYLVGNADLHRVRSVSLFVGTIGNSDTASITLGKYAVVEAEDVISMPQFSGPTEVVVAVGAAVNATVTGTGYPGPTVTRTGDLPPGVTATQTGSSVQFTGSPTTVGTWTTTLNGATVDWLTTRHTVTFRTHVPPTISGDQSVDARVGQEVTHALDVTGAPNLAASFSPALPAGLSASLSGSTLTISGTPSGPGGAFATTATVSTAYASASLALTIEIAAQPTLGTVTDRLVGVGEELTLISVPMSGYPAPSLTATGLPPGVTATATATAVEISGTPTSAGVFPVTLTATNGVGTDASTSFRLTVGTAPELTVAPTVTASVGEAVEVPVAVTGLPAATVAATGLPDGVNVVMVGDGWALSGTPTRLGMGERTATVTATNAVGSDSADVAFTVTGAPELSVPDPVEATVGSPVDVTVGATGYPVPGLAATNLPPGLTATDDGAGHLLIQGTPTTSGTWGVALAGTSTAGTDAAILPIEVGTAPVFDDGDALTLTVREGTATSRLIAASGYPSHAVALVAGALPAGMTLAADGTLSGTPAAGSADAGNGRYVSTLRASNRSGTDDLALTIVVLSPPTTDLPATVTIAADAPADVVFHTGGWDRPTVTATGLPAGLSLVRDAADDTAWHLVGTVARADRGPHTVALTLENAYGHAPRTLRVDVTAATEVSLSTAALLVEVGVPSEPFTLTITGYPVDEGCGTWAPLGLAVVDGTSSATERTFDLTLTASLPGRYPARFGGCSGPMRDLTVTAVHRPAIDAPGTADLLAGDVADVPVNVTGDPAAPLTATGLPEGLALVAGAAPGEWHLAGTPTRAAAGDHEVTLTVDNGLTTTHTLTITVGAAPEAAVSTYTQTTEIGQLVGVGFVVTGYPQPTITVEGMPPGIPERVDPDGWVYVWGTPTQAGTFTTTIHIANAHGSLESVVTTVVHQEPAFADDALDLALIEGVEGSLSLPLVGYPDPAVTMTGEVPGMTLTHTPGSDPLLSGTPAPGSAGTYVLDVTAANSVVDSPRSATARITVRVDARAAFTAGTDALAAAVGTPVDRPVQVAGSPVPGLTATGLPDGLSLVAGAAPGEFRITGTPTAGSGGRYTAHLVAENGVLDPATADVPVEVTEPVRLAAGLDGTAALREGAPTRVGVATSGGWPTAVTLRVEGALPPGLSFVDDGDGTGQVVGTPSAGTTGRWSVVVAADNGAAVTRAPLVLDVAAAPAPVRPTTPGTRPGSGGPTTAATTGDGPASDTTGEAADDDAGDDAAGTDDGSGDGTDDEAADAGDDAQAAPPVLDPEETVRTESGRPWWWVLGAVLVGAVLLGLRTIERKLRGM